MIDADVAILTSADIDHTEEWEAVFHPLASHLDPNAAIVVDYDDRDLREAPPEGAAYVLTDAPLDDKSWYRDLEKALLADVRTDRPLEARRNTALKLYARIGEADAAMACEAPGNIASRPGAVRSERDPSGARGSKDDFEVCSSSHSPAGTISGPEWRLPCRYRV